MIKYKILNEKEYEVIRKNKCYYKKGINERKRRRFK